MILYGLRNQEQEVTESNNWSIIFSDLMSLCLTFFILLFSMSDSEKSTHLKEHSRTLGIEVDFIKNAVSDEENNIYSQELDYLYTVSKEKLGKYPSLKDVKLERMENKLLFIIPDNLIFQPDSDEIMPQAGKMVSDVSETFKSLHAPIIVTGWASNWNLALTKAVKITEIIKSDDFSQNITATSDISNRTEFENNIVIEIIASTPHAVEN